MSKGTRITIVLFSVIVAVVASLGVQRLYPQPLDARPVTDIPAAVFDGRGLRLVLPGRELVAEIGTYDEELLAYLLFDYMRARWSRLSLELLLTARNANGVRSYRVMMHLPNDLLSAIPLLTDLKGYGHIDRYSLRYEAPVVLERQRAETRVYTATYTVPVKRTLEELPHSVLRSGTRAFVMFKSMTDPRTWPSAITRLRRLDLDEAGKLAEDMIAVADFYDLPLDSMLGIGAMENNYLNVSGDLNHVIWKRRAEPGDLVVRRRRARVLVKNNSIGVWQITRETLRRAHALFLADTRNYALLPERLRPPHALDLDHVDPQVLTTYAALLFRSLLDYFHGDLAKAVGAYNGGPANPVAKYEHGVGMVAAYARTVLEHYDAESR